MLQNGRLAQSYEKGIAALEDQVLELERERARETDPEKIGDLDKKIQEAAGQIESLKKALEAIRKPIGEPVEVLIEAT